MADQIVIKCQKCGHKLVTGSQFIGRKGRCPNCGAVIRLQRSGEGRPDGSEAQVVAIDQIETPKDSLLTIVKQNDVAVVRFSTSRILDQSNVRQLGEELDSLIEKYKLKKLVINFENVSYMSSAVMGKLVSLLKKTKATGGKLNLCGIEPGIYEIFEIMRFDRMFDIHDNEDTAVAELMD
ncbi:MAG: anti-sigma factor antagonist [Planctomycetes bacterium]|nr:anti-sigma factor antagonist [Planctomycetota bacterium]